ncbi:MAG: thioesterase [Synergistaceae bacterium]|nr:thioesterase [Synergistaceae bacterium]
MTERDFEFSLGAIDPCGRIKHKYLLEIFQEMAEIDAAKYNFAVFQVLERKMTWVLRSYRIDFQRYPCREDRILKIKTYAEIYRNLFSLRTFEVRNAEGKLLGAAKTWWVLIDLERKRPLRLDRIDGTEKFLAKISEDYPDEVKIPKIEKSDFKFPWQVRWQDLDVNDHTNHTVYFSWVLESVPFDVPEKYAPVFAEAQYLKPVPRESIICLTREIPSEGSRRFLHSLKSEEGTEYARLWSVWKKDERKKIEAVNMA